MIPYQTDHNRLKWMCDLRPALSPDDIALTFDDGHPVATVETVMFGIEQSVVLRNESLPLSQYSSVLSRECVSLSDITNLSTTTLN